MIKVLAIALTFIFSLTASAENLKGFIYVNDNPNKIDSQHIVREFIRNETAFSAFIVQGFATDSSGKVNLSADIKFIDPAGNILFGQKDYALSNAKVANNQRAITLSNSFDISFEQTDPLGMYTVAATIKDNISKTSIITETTLLLFDSQKSKDIIMRPVQTGKDLDNLWFEYFRSKNPWAVKRVIKALSLRDSPNLNPATVGSAAQWSLESNAKQHPDVLAICKQSLKYTSGTTKKLLQELINNVERK